MILSFVNSSILVLRKTIDVRSFDKDALIAIKGISTTICDIFLMNLVLCALILVAGQRMAYIRCLNIEIQKKDNYD